MDRTKSQAPEAVNSEVIGRSISYVYRKATAETAACLREIGLTSAQSIVLVGVYRYEGVNQKKLSETISMDTAPVSRVLTQLEKSGFIERVRDEDNRRNFLLYLTPSGRSLAEKSLQLQSEYWERISEEFTPDQWESLARLLEHLLGSLQ